MFSTTRLLQLLGALTLAVSITPAFCFAKEHPQASWDYYLANCQRMQETIADVQSGRVSAAYALTSGLQDSLASMNERRLNLLPQHLDSSEYAHCENVAAHAEATLAQGKAEFAAQMQRGVEEGRIAHQNSPAYQRARSLGYSDVGDISFLKLHEDTDCEARLKTMLITVDEICGQYFRATQ